MHRFFTRRTKNPKRLCVFGCMVDWGKYLALPTYLYTKMNLISARRDFSTSLELVDSSLYNRSSVLGCGYHLKRTLLHTLLFKQVFADSGKIFYQPRYMGAIRSKREQFWKSTILSNCNCNWWSSLLTGPPTVNTLCYQHFAFRRITKIMRHLTILFSDTPDCSQL